jgi:hypothetical protein
MPNFLNNAQITQMYNDAVNQGKKVLYRHGIDYRFTDNDGSSMKGSKRNKIITLEGLLHQADHYFIELEDGECDAGQIVFHGYSELDME